MEYLSWAWPWIVEAIEKKVVATIVATMVPAIILSAIIITAVVINRWRKQSCCHKG